jgi:hypothetical protein
LPARVIQIADPCAEAGQADLCLEEAVVVVGIGRAVDENPAEFARLTGLAKAKGLEGALDRRDAAVRAYAELLDLWAPHLDPPWALASCDPDDRSCASDRDGQYQSYCNPQAPA